jgi:hypothetical protein
VLRRFFEEVAFVEWGGPAAERGRRLDEMRALTYNDVSADRAVVAAVQALEAILAAHAAGKPGGVVFVNGDGGGLVLRVPNIAESQVLYAPRV